MAKQKATKKQEAQDEIFIKREDVNQYETYEYKTEKQLEEIIIENITAFCKNILEDEYISHERQYNINGRKGGNKRRTRYLLIIDILIKCKHKNYVVELKKPKFISGNREAIGQLLNYGLYFDETKTELILVTTKLDTDTACVIDKYKLPIKYIFIDKNRYAIHNGTSK